MAGFWVQQDAPQILRNRLRQAFPKSQDLFHAELPDKWTARDGPIVTIASDGPQTSAAGTDKELVRVTCRHIDLPRARQLFTQIDAFLTSPGINTLGFSIPRRAGTGLVVGPDSLIGGYFASRVYSVGTTRKVQNELKA